MLKAEQAPSARGAARGAWLLGVHIQTAELAGQICSSCLVSQPRRSSRSGWGRQAWPEAGAVWPASPT